MIDEAAIKVTGNLDATLTGPVNQGTHVDKITTTYFYDRVP